MKRFTAFLLAVVLVMTCVATVACKSDAVKVFLHYQDGKTNTGIEVYNDRFTLPTPTREGYTFGGWYLDEACTDGNKFEAGTPMDASFHLYAKWTANTQKFTVTFVYNDGVTDNKQVEVAAGQTVTLPKPTREGYDFAGWYETQQGGVQWAQNNPVTKDTTLYARWNKKSDGTETHTHDFGNSYFLYVQCSVVGCSVYGRAESTNYYENVFVYNFDAKKATEILACYNELKAYLGRADVSEYQAFESRYEDYYDYVDYVVEQYQYAYVFYCTYDDASYAEAYGEISAYYNDIVANFYGLYADIYAVEAFRSLFFDPEYWTEDDVQQALYLAAAYGEGSENQNAADQIVSDYYDVLDQMDALYESYSNEEITEDEYNTQYAALQAQMFDLYTQFVTVNNQIARDAQYANYMDYAYKNVYGREYEPSDVAAMQQYVKDYVGPIIAKVVEAYQAFEGFDTYDSLYLYYGLVVDTVFANTISDELLTEWNADESEFLMANQYVGNYFKYLSSTTAGSKEINFFNAVEDLFKKGNYFVGSSEQAYTYYIPAHDLSILYFGGDDYTNAFTFVHEFGHYYNGIYNGGLSLSMDHDETQSQGNEMLFLGWLANQTAGSSALASGFEALELEQLLNVLATIIMSTAVDEFEQAAYSGAYSNGQPLPTISATIDGEETTVIDYQTMYETILNSYWSDMGEYFNTEYWSYVVFDSAAYYISYAMSALPSLEIYVTARQQGLNVARDCYLKLFTFSDYETAVDTDGDGECTYQEILNWCGLKGPFQSELYTTISTYFSSRNLA